MTPPPPRLPGAPYPAFDGSQPCTRFPVTMFFPEGGEHPSVYAQAKAVCFGCPFRTACIAYSLSHDVGGIWGGMSEAERKRIRSAIGVFPQLVSVGDQETVRNRIDALDDGTRSAVEIAEQAGCNPKTVERRRKEAA